MRNEPKVPPSLRRAMNTKLSKKETDELAPPFKRMKEVNKAANKYKWAR